MTNEVEKALQLVKKGAKLISFNNYKDRLTPLHQACINGQYEMAEALADLHVKQVICLETYSDPECQKSEEPGTPY